MSELDFLKRKLCVLKKNVSNTEHKIEKIEKTLSLPYKNIKHMDHSAFMADDLWDSVSRCEFKKYGRYIFNVRFSLPKQNGSNIYAHIDGKYTFPILTALKSTDGIRRAKIFDYYSFIPECAKKDKLISKIEKFICNKINTFNAPIDKSSFNLEYFERMSLIM